MSSSSRLYAIVGRLGNDSAKRLRIGGVAKTPYIFYLLLRKIKSFGNIDVGGEKSYAWRVGGLVEGRGMGGVWCRVFRDLRRRRRRRREARRCS